MDWFCNDSVHSGKKGTFLQIGKELLHGRFRCPGYAFNRAVWHIPDLALYAVLTGLSGCKLPESNALHPALNDDAQGHDLWRRRVHKDR